ACPIPRLSRNPTTKHTLMRDCNPCRSHWKPRTPRKLTGDTQLGNRVSSILFRTQPGRGSWLADMLGRLAVRYPEVHVVLAGSRRFAEEWAYRLLGAARAGRLESI